MNWMLLFFFDYWYHILLAILNWDSIVCSLEGRDAINAKITAAELPGSSGRLVLLV